ncbi:MAG: Translation initiation factor IF-3 [Parcubacteria group bacterium GW2011_GWA2_47_8]|nr:MAG: Translation initiation factor IF-3 [Parcubacteria group bacterium GW2011_GWA2_47_8]OHB20296.1 MAG: translation initiation factor IF-3 [Parcubacteria group bacterium RIFCSPHIGHO2_01_FULL_47_10b]
MNSQIRIPEVRLIDEEEKVLGVVPTAQAMQMAQERGLDLVEVQPTAKPSVCRLMDYKKFLYRQSKAKKQSKPSADKLKSVQFSMRISEHDLETKARRTGEFLTKGHRVKIQLVIRGRENAHRELVQPQIDKFISSVPVEAVMDAPPKRLPGGMFFILRKKERKNTATTVTQNQDQVKDSHVKNK